MPKLEDDGETVTLDLHGANVEEAEQLAIRLIKEASLRGRSRVRLIHGSSSSSRLYLNRTIKHMLHALLDTGRMDDWVTGDHRGEAVLTLSLELTPQTDNRRISLLELSKSR